jgi:hypothetical protein
MSFPHKDVTQMQTDFKWSLSKVERMSVVCNLFSFISIVNVGSSEFSCRGRTPGPPGLFELLEGGGGHTMNVAPIHASFLCSVFETCSVWYI